MEKLNIKKSFEMKKNIKSKKKSALLDNIYAWLFLAPYLFFFASFLYYPIIKGFKISFYKYSIGTANKFIGLDNYAYMLKDSAFWEALRNTVYFVIISVPALVIFGLVTALIVNAGFKGSTLLRSSFYIPYILSISVVASIWVFILQPYSGLLTSILHSIGFKGEIFWLDNQWLAWISILIATVWWTVGFNMVLFLAGLQDIPDSYYEAAKIDGANSWQLFSYITLPSLKRVILLVSVLQTIASFKLFGQSYLMTNGGPGTATRTLVQYIYEMGFKNLKMGQASAMSYVLFLIMAIFAIIQFKVLPSED